MEALQNLPYLNVCLLAVATWVLLKHVQIVPVHIKPTKLSGPPSTSLLLGVTKEVFAADLGDIFEQWAEKFGPVYQIPAPFGERHTVLMDPRAVAHFYSKDTFTYHRNNFARQMTDRLVCAFIRCRRCRLTQNE